jgi:short-subunit dehydrogenase
MELAGKTVLLTGATGGLGRAIASSLASRGARLVLSSRKAEELEQLAGSLPGDGHRPLVADLAEPGTLDPLLAEAGEVDGLVANAGLPGTGRVETYSEEQVSRVVRVNLEAPIQMARALIPGMRERGQGHLVFISSLSGKAATPRTAIYAATKFGLRGFAFSLREDLWGTGVGVSIVSPGFISDAGMFHDSGAKSPPGMGTKKPHDVGEAVASAIERNRSEVAVAPLFLRILADISYRRPELVGRLAHRRAGHDIADNIARGHERTRKR